MSTAPSKTPIILDCDPGHDDAIALLLALASPEVELVAVTTVAGNQTSSSHRQSMATPASTDPTFQIRISRSSTRAVRCS